MDNNTINLFIPISPSHIVNFELLLISKTIKKGKNILLNPANFECQEEYWDEVISDNIKYTSNEITFIKKTLYQINKIRQTKKFIKKTKKHLKNNKSFILFYCNLEDILTNFFFFKYCTNNTVDKILVEDGVLNYYEYKVEEKKNKQFKLKVLLGCFLRVPFNSFKGNVTGIDFKSVSKQYVRTPDLSVRPDKSIQLPYPKIDYKPDPNVILFIGQDIIANIVGRTEYLKKVDYYFSMIKKKVNTNSIKIIYKPHRNGNYELIDSLGKKHFGESFSYFLGQTPVEEAVAVVKPSSIFTFSSSGILNIKMTLSDTVNVSFYAFPFASNPQLIALFKKFDIRIIE
jgi:hypothetical protein